MCARINSSFHSSNTCTGWVVLIYFYPPVKGKALFSSTKRAPWRFISESGFIFQGIWNLAMKKWHPGTCSLLKAILRFESRQTGMTFKWILSFKWFLKLHLLTIIGELNIPWNICFIKWWLSILFFIQINICIMG